MLIMLLNWILIIQKIILIFSNYKYRQLFKELMNIKQKKINRKKSMIINIITDNYTIISFS